MTQLRDQCTGQQQQHKEAVRDREDGVEEMARGKEVVTDKDLAGLVGVRQPGPVTPTLPSD